MTLVYIAGPLFNVHERRYLEEIAHAFERHGYATYLPHRDAGVIVDWNDANRTPVFNMDLAALDRCDACGLTYGCRPRLRHLRRVGLSLWDAQTMLWHYG